MFKLVLSLTLVVLTRAKPGYIHSAPTIVHDVIATAPIAVPAPVALPIPQDVSYTRTDVVSRKITANAPATTYIGNGAVGFLNNAVPQRVKNVHYSEENIISGSQESTQPEGKPQVNFRNINVEIPDLQGIQLGGGQQENGGLQRYSTQPGPPQMQPQPQPQSQPQIQYQPRFQSQQQSQPQFQSQSQQQPQSQPQVQYLPQFQSQEQPQPQFQSQSQQQLQSQFQSQPQSRFSFGHTGYQLTAEQLQQFVAASTPAPVQIARLRQPSGPIEFPAPRLQAEQLEDFDTISVTPVPSNSEQSFSGSGSNTFDLPPVKTIRKTYFAPPAFAYSAPIGVSASHILGVAPPKAVAFPVAAAAPIAAPTVLSSHAAPLHWGFIAPAPAPVAPVFSSHASLIHKGYIAASPAVLAEPVPVPAPAIAKVHAAAPVVAVEKAVVAYETPVTKVHYKIF